MKKHSRRRGAILDAALALAEVKGYQHITREEIAARAKCSDALVSYHFTTMPQLRRALMRHAVIVKNLKVVGQGLGNGDGYARLAPEDLKIKAINALVG